MLVSRSGGSRAARYAQFACETCAERVARERPLQSQEPSIMNSPPVSLAAAPPQAFGATDMKTGIIDRHCATPSRAPPAFLLRPSFSSAGARRRAAPDAPRDEVRMVP